MSGFSAFSAFPAPKENTNAAGVSSSEPNGQGAARGASNVTAQRETAFSAFGQPPTDHAFGGAHLAAGNAFFNAPSTSAGSALGSSTFGASSPIAVSSPISSSMPGSRTQSPLLKPQDTITWRDIKSTPGTPPFGPAKGLPHAGSLGGSFAAANDVRLQRFSSAATDGKDDAVTLFHAMRKQREGLRTQYIAAGILPDPTKAQELESAQKFLGTCPDMCPQFERVEREMQKELDALEVYPGTAKCNPEIAVKIYRRPAAGREVPLPEDVRPPEVLKTTLDYLFHDLLPSGPFDPTFNQVQAFVWNRTRAIRQDFIVQNERGRLAIECHERIARYHILTLHFRGGLVGSDGTMRDTTENTDGTRSENMWSEQQELEQLRKTLRSLIEFYDDKRVAEGDMEAPASQNEGEFRAYNLLLHLRDPETLREVESLPEGVFMHPFVQSSLRLRRYAQKSNNIVRRGQPRNEEATLNWFSRFFREIRSKDVGYLQACLAENAFSEVRVGAFKALARCFRKQFKPLPTSWVVDALGFDDAQQAIDVARQYGLLVELDAVGEESSTIAIHQEAQLSEDKPVRTPFSMKIVEAKREERSFQDIVDGFAAGAVAPAKAPVPLVRATTPALKPSVATSLPSSTAPKSPSSLLSGRFTLAPSALTSKATPFTSTFGVGSFSATPTISAAPALPLAPPAASSAIPALTPSSSQQAIASTEKPSSAKGLQTLSDTASPFMPRQPTAPFANPAPSAAILAQAGGNPVQSPLQVLTTHPFTAGSPQNTKKGAPVIISRPEPIGQIVISHPSAGVSEPPFTIPQPKLKRSASDISAASQRFRVSMADKIYARLLDEVAVSAGESMAMRVARREKLARLEASREVKFEAAGGLLAERLFDTTARTMSRAAALDASGKAFISARTLERVWSIWLRRYEEAREWKRIRHRSTLLQHQVQNKHQKATVNKHRIYEEREEGADERIATAFAERHRLCGTLWRRGTFTMILYDHFQSLFEIYSDLWPPRMHIIASFAGDPGHETQACSTWLRRVLSEDCFTFSDGKQTFLLHDGSPAAGESSTDPQHRVAPVPLVIFECASSAHSSWASEKARLHALGQKVGLHNRHTILRPKILLLRWPSHAPHMPEQVATELQPELSAWSGFLVVSLQTQDPQTMLESALALLLSSLSWTGAAIRGLTGILTHFSEPWLRAISASSTCLGQLLDSRGVQASAAASQIWRIICALGNLLMRYIVSAAESDGGLGDAIQIVVPEASDLPNRSTQSEARLDLHHLITRTIAKTQITFQLDLRRLQLELDNLQDTLTDAHIAAVLRQLFEAGLSGLESGDSYSQNLSDSDLLAQASSFSRICDQAVQEIKDVAASGLRPPAINGTAGIKRPAPDATRTNSIHMKKARPDMGGVTQVAIASSNPAISRLKAAMAASKQLA
ncbi:hypothetical protein K437DRAFT_46275 [Tilletiaria anomala UBC 951]|uniref:SAC3/GANP/THP3 conserved domain-containing protein n=1 Tax=Tilletiaria anomala (strain ATCC 24038 / CBS 436.72 / UBC 951) TaxID=1037660 RepID=A0A066WLZ7_TILAU|nr:uncharacterized protein K437DRAFT_46275 [Tilletiaria anomala UBC 951]KDN52024.1 hypothetical protein K437DRAFT_46275 [Tilletiaria anomala UBC 951]